MGAAGQNACAPILYVVSPDHTAGYRAQRPGGSQHERFPLMCQLAGQTAAQFAKTTLVANDAVPCELGVRH